VRFAKKLLVTTDQWQLTICETISSNYEFALGFCKFKPKAPLLSWQSTTLQVERQRCPRTESDNGEPPWNLTESQGGSRLVSFKQTSRQASLHPYVRAKVMFMWEYGKTKQWPLAILIQFESQWSFATWEKLICKSLASHFLIGHEEYGNSKAQN